MKLYLSELPTEFAEWPQWLDRALAGNNLPQLIAELSAVNKFNETTSPTINLHSLCEDKLSEVCEVGTSALSPAQLQVLLKHPSLLLSLQEEILQHGGDYWSGLLAESSDPLARGSVWELIGLNSDIELESKPGGASTAPAVTPSGKLRPAASGRRRAFAGLLGAAVAVAALFAFVLPELRSPNAPTWGFDRSNLLTAEVSSEDYLRSLATASHEWFNKRPDTQQALAQRIKDFEHGCDTLIAAAHPQLANEDRLWLIERCQSWKATLTGIRTSLESGELSTQAALTSADETIRKLETALNARAESIAT